MKKIILSLCLGMFLFISISTVKVSAQTISISTSSIASMTSSQKQALIQSLIQIISQLTTRLNLLLAQKQNNSGTSTSTINTLTQSFVLSRDLTVGSKGEDVTVLQKFLISEGFLLKNSDGYFDNETKVALAKYQVSKEIYPALGYFGPKTRNVINPINISSTSTIITPTKSSSASSSSGGGSYSSGSSGGGQSSSLPVSPISQPTSTTTNATSTLVDPTASLTVNGSHSVTVYPGDSISYVWSGSGADTFTSSSTSNSSNCSSSENWVANSAKGSVTYVVPTSDGCVLTVSYKATQSSTGKSSSDKVTVNVVKKETTSTTTVATTTGVKDLTFYLDPSGKVSSSTHNVYKTLKELDTALQSQGLTKGEATINIQSGTYPAQSFPMGKYIGMGSNYDRSYVVFDGQQEGSESCITFKGGSLNNVTIQNLSCDGNFLNNAVTVEENSTLENVLVQNNKVVGIKIAGSNVNFNYVTSQKNAVGYIVGNWQGIGMLANASDVKLIKDISIKNSASFNNNNGIVSPQWAGQQYTYYYGGKWYLQSFYCGSSKVAFTNNITFDNFQAAYNVGPGMWFDTSNYNITVISSNFHDNWGDFAAGYTGGGYGLVVEVSYGPSLIKYNTFSNNSNGGVAIMESWFSTIDSNNFQQQWVKPIYLRALSRVGENNPGNPAYSLYSTSISGNAYPASTCPVTFSTSSCVIPTTPNLSQYGISYYSYYAN